MTDLNQNAKQPEASLDDRVRDYFSSIEDSFEVTLSIPEANNTGDWILPTAVLTSLLTLIPVVPSVAWFVFTRIFAPGTLVIHGRAIPVASFWFWYFSLAIIIVALTALVILKESRGSKAREEQIKKQSERGLGTAATRFALCYALADEIDRYTKNHISKHIEQALTYWHSLLRSLGLLFGSGRVIILHEPVDFDTIDARAIQGRRLPIDDRRRGLFFGEIERLEINHSWFKLEPNTRRIVNALDTLPEKISGRLKDKKDLFLVGDALRNLSRYLYSVIPELSSEDGGHQDVEILGEPGAHKVRATDRGVASLYRGAAPATKKNRKLPES